VSIDLSTTEPFYTQNCFTQRCISLERPKNVYPAVLRKADNVAHIVGAEHIHTFRRVHPVLGLTFRLWVPTGKILQSAIFCRYILQVYRKRIAFSGCGAPEKAIRLFDDSFQ
jgi:hypothetical protein